MSCKQPFFSIVIPIYNAEKYLKNCIKSILCQSFEDFELILVDDGSTDSSSEICKKFESKDSRIKFFRKPNGGCLQTRIYGVEKSSGKYILFCDADDYYLNQYCFSKLYKQISIEKIDLVQFKTVSKYPFFIKKTPDSDNIKIINKEDFYQRDYPILLCSYCASSRITGNVWNKVYKRELFRNMPSSGDIGRIFMGEDFIINLHLLHNIDKAMFIDSSIYVYRKMIGGTSNFKKDIMKEVDILKEYQWSFLQKWNGDKKDSVVRMHFAETAGWLHNYAQNGLEFLPEDELKEKITDAFELPNVKRAREYLKTNTENYPEFKLIVAGDPSLYIAKAKETLENQPPKNKIKKAAFTIIKKILR